MLAAILTSQNKPLLVDDVEMPQDLKLGQVLVKVHLSGICGSQLGEITGAKGQDKFLPHLMGHEGCGTVIDVGPGVKTVKKNDLVVLHWKKGDGLQSEVPVYKWNGGKLNAGWVTTFNSHAIISENRCTSINKDLSIQSQYNTYLHKGLPPGPINNPGFQSIFAALYPEKSEYIYFVAKGDGYHTFSKTKYEHDIAKKKFDQIRKKIKQNKKGNN